MVLRSFPQLGLDLFNFNVVDTLKVPDVKGEYVLSWRWGKQRGSPLYAPVICTCTAELAARSCNVCAFPDCEQTPQIWAGCADITIE